jgi:hypothetical protein
MQSDLDVYLPGIGSHWKQQTPAHVNHIARRTLCQLWATRNILEFG